MLTTHTSAAAADAALAGAAISSTHMQQMRQQVSALSDAFRDATGKEVAATVLYELVKRGFDVDRVKTLIAQNSMMIIANSRITDPTDPATFAKNPQLKAAPGGLATALAALFGEVTTGDLLLTTVTGEEIGLAAKLAPTSRKFLREGLKGNQRYETLRLGEVSLRSSEIKDFYEGLSNDVLWPLMHAYRDDQGKQVFFDSCNPVTQEHWEAYRAANLRYAATALTNHIPGQPIWVHDYQLMLVPDWIRDRDPSARIGYFHHIPFPEPSFWQAAAAKGLVPTEIQERLLHGLLGANFLAFHTAEYVENFIATLKTLGIVKADQIKAVPPAPYSNNLARYEITLNDRTVRVAVCPINIDLDTINAIVQSPKALADAVNFHRLHPYKYTIFSAERCDYTKGVVEHALAIERLFERRPDLIGQVELIQLPQKTRQNVPTYQAYYQRVLDEIDRVNAKFARPKIGYQPIFRSEENPAWRELLVQAAESAIILVTPWRDGMNLVCKEAIVAASYGVGGKPNDLALILGKGCGAAHELTAAIQVDGANVDALARAIEQAIEKRNAPGQCELRAARQRMFRILQQNSLRHWLDDNINGIRNP